MTDRLDEMLRELARAMADHGRVLAGFTPPPPTTAPHTATDRREVLIARLLQGAERRCGLRLSETLTARLGNAFARVALDELEAWVMHLDRLHAEDGEWLDIFEWLTVHETYFFRDPAQLALLRDKALPPAIVEAGRARRPLRIWSSGCATGEEVYTLAALAFDALAAAGHAAEAEDGYALQPPWELDVLGTDLSRAALRQAATARYETGELSPFRAVPQSSMRFFPVAGRSDGTARTVRGDLRRHARFQFFNLLSEAPPQRDFDIVSCRNVLVYLETTARHAAQRVLEAAVRPGGFLILGPTDAPLDGARFAAVWGEQSVLYHRTR